MAIRGCAETLIGAGGQRDPECALASDAVPVEAATQPDRTQAKSNTVTQQLSPAPGPLCAACGVGPSNRGQGGPQPLARARHNGQTDKPSRVTLMAVGTNQNRFTASAAPRRRYALHNPSPKPLTCSIPPKLRVKQGGKPRFKRGCSSRQKGVAEEKELGGMKNEVKCKS
ncbi:unnamed protein product [Pleuronectes platessa]|uniref:Uncharacterized protein n=1 Tax=Pleuronectes platessa TaxID=8262 RepID=A0A9N7YF54_PLEPL|nr:unnamed protein product [Pleuronectes platessa]